MHGRKRPTHLVIAALMLALACGPCSLVSRQWPTPPNRIVVSSEAAAALESRIQENLSGPPGQEFILRMTDAEVTSYLSAELANTDGAPIENLVVWFTKGKLYATGRLVNVVPISTDFFMIASPKIEDGRVVISIDQFSAGTIPVPRKALDLISQSLTETIAEMQPGVEVTALEVLEGEAIIQGIRQ